MTLEAEFTEHAPFLRALARRLATDPSIADDIVQETYVAALTAAPRHTHGLVPWLAAVLQNRAARRIRTDTRRRAREQTIARHPTTTETADVAIKLDVARRLLQHVETLDSAYRDAIFLRYYENLKPQQIADRLAVPLGTVKTRLARALTQLRERLDADHPEGRQNWLPALCAIGGIDPGAPGILPGNAAVVSRAPVLRHVLIAATVVLTGTVAITALFWNAADPAPTQSATTNSAAVLEQTNVDPHARREPLAAASQVALVHGLVEDAAIGTVPGYGQPAANVVVRGQLRQPSEPASSPGEGGTDPRTPALLSVPSPGKVEVETTTDAQGRFQIEVPEGAALIAVKVDGTEILRAARWTAATGPNERPDPPERLVLTRYPHGRLEGLVTEPSGTAVAGARVTLTHRQDGERVAIETTADQDGRFVFPDPHPGSWLTAEREGFIEVGRPRLERLPRGGWQPAHLLLAPTETLTVELVDSTGQPARHVESVGVVVGMGEIGLFATSNCTPKLPPTMAPTAAGRATLAVPAGLDLLLFAGESQFAREQNGQGVASASGSPTGQPIVVGAGENRLLRLVLGTDITVRVAVVDPDGRSVAGADISFKMVRDGYLESIRMASTDARGQFELPLSGAEKDQFLLITARGTGASADLRAVRWLRIDGTEPSIAELRLAKAQNIVGHVRDANGQAVKAQIRHLLLFPGERESVGSRGGWSTDKSGAFSFPGTADAVQQLEILSDGFATVVLDDVRPGAPIEVVLERRKRTRIRLLTSAVATGIGDLEVRVGHLEANGGIDPAWPALGATTPWSHAAPHAVASLPLPQRIRRPEGTWRLESHRRLPLVDGPTGRAFELMLDSGPAWISVSGSGADDEPLARMTTGLVTITGDVVELPLVLSPTVTCRGRIMFGEGSERFPACVALADDTGRLLMVSVQGYDYVWETVASASSHGHFALSGVPVGTWELRVGTRAELERGEARLRRRVVIAGGAAEPIEVKL